MTGVREDMTRMYRFRMEWGWSTPYTIDDIQKWLQVSVPTKPAGEPIDHARLASIMYEIYQMEGISSEEELEAFISAAEFFGSYFVVEQ